MRQELIWRGAQVIEKMERETGLEPATSSLGSWHSTTELLPRCGISGPFQPHYSIVRFDPGRLRQECLNAFAMGSGFSTGAPALEPFPFSRFPEATHHCHGLQSSAGRPGAVDGA